MAETHHGLFKAEVQRIGDGGFAGYIKETPGRC